MPKNSDTEELKEIKEYVKTIQRNARKISLLVSKALQEDIKTEPPEWLVDRAKIWLDIHNANKEHIVTKEQFHKIAKKHEYDMRGLGGFFTGKYPSLVMVSGGRVALTDYAIETLVEYGFIEEENAD